MVRERYRHYQELSSVNDHQSDLEIRDDPHAFYEVLLVVEHKRRRTFPFSFADTSIT
jgi:hypothetical protein